ncbi:hypothetical protein K8640_30705 [Myxococcus sp. XM-1-1-1]|uniref:hypothetical protein n=1 Tax=Myxococcus sp. XM-1-1-1 TaxID=2874602 RepID=UPI001CC10683|nr:hypothetical protein [Myxococcus sp. XM-1-1-1]MBZ4412605.1 hypothetical protein [Myxococcus sp. XM-1-1-1]
MAIDFMVLPLSRYIVGDFITPAMRSAWASGVPYSVIGPEGARQLPEGLPFGGPEAPVRRARVIDMLVEALRQFPGATSDALWDERSRRRGEGDRVHVAAMLFLPRDFEATFEMTTPLRRLTGSTPRALAALERMHWPDNAKAAVDSLRAALVDSRDHQVPMLVDW